MVVRMTSTPGTRDIAAMEEEILELRKMLDSCHRAMTIVAASLNLNEVLQNAIQSAMSLMNAEAAAIMLVDDATGDLLFQQATGAAADAVREIRIPRGHGIAGWVAQTGESMVVADAQNDPRFFRGADDQTGFVTRSILATPLRVLDRETGKDRIIGVAEVINKRSGNFREADLPAFQGYAALAAVAIQNAQMHGKLVNQEVFQREVHIAREIQERLQGPSQAASGHLHWYATTAPARSVGGDFFDWIELGDGRTLAVIGDVSGKGVPAAILMSNTVSRLKSEAPRLIEPQAILSAVNNAIAAQAHGGLFVTIFLALFSPDGIVKYASAGHHMPLRYAAGKFLEVAKVKGPPVGVLPGARYTQDELRMDEGELLVLFTDGVTEARSSRDEFFGYEGLRHVVAGAARHPDRIPLKVRLAVERHESGMEQSDDLTLGIVHYSSRPAPLFMAFDHLHLDDMASIRQSCEDYLKRLGIDEKLRTRLVFAVDEAATNVYRHAYGGEGGPMQLKCWREDDDLWFQMTDTGCGAMPSVPAEERREVKPGGLGLHVLRDVMDDVRFEGGATGGCLLRMRKKLVSAP